MCDGLAQSPNRERLRVSWEWIWCNHQIWPCRGLKVGCTPCPVGRLKQQCFLKVINDPRCDGAWTSTKFKYFKISDRDHIWDVFEAEMEIGDMKNGFKTCLVRPWSWFQHLSGILWFVYKVKGKRVCLSSLSIDAPHLSPWNLSHLLAKAMSPATGPPRHFLLTTSTVVSNLL